MSIEWISVEDRLPDLYGRYLIIADYSKYDMPGGVSTEMAIYNHEDKGWHSLESGGNSCITHWQPLPSPPEGE